MYHYYTKNLQPFEGFRTRILYLFVDYMLVLERVSTKPPKS